MREIKFPYDFPITHYSPAENAKKSFPGGCHMATTVNVSRSAVRARISYRVDGMKPYITKVFAALLGLCLSSSLAATAQDYPARNVVATLGYAPGGGADIPVRYFAEKLGKLAKQTFIVDNKPGAQASLAAAIVSKAKPDGYTILFAAGNALVAAPSLIKDISFDPVKDFGYIATLWQTPYVLIVNASSPVSSVAELTEDLKKKGGKATFGYQGIINLAAAELYKKSAGVQATAVSYKSVQQILPDLSAGDISFAFVDATFAFAQIRNGQAKALAVTTPQRTSMGPNVPTMQEAGIPDFDIRAWFAIYVPPATPEAIKTKLRSLVSEVLQTAETRDFIRSLGIEPFVSTSEEFAKFQVEETARWAAILKEAGVSAQ
jgi:tripartite-type tricarboxylate transporter receptor subunit TctC